MSAEQHRAHGRRSVACAIVTVSDTRTPETDTSGARIRALLEGAGHRVVATAILPDEPELVRAHVRGLLAAADVEAIVTNGGTGLAPRDTTYEAIVGLLDKTLDGFGELFRMLSFAEIGAAAMLSRATAGLVAGRAIFLLPGSPAALGLALSRLVLPEIAHLMAQARRPVRSERPD